MLKIRLSRHGKKHKPFYWLVVSQSTSPRDGKFIEKLGTYNPFSKEINVESERILHWLNVGSQPTEKAADLLLKAGLKHDLIKQVDTSNKPKKAPKQKKS